MCWGGFPIVSGSVLFRYGYKGFYNRKKKPVVLNSKAVEGIQLQGGTILGTSRGGADIKYELAHPPYGCKLLSMQLLS